MKYNTRNEFFCGNVKLEVQDKKYIRVDLNFKNLPNLQYNRNTGNCYLCMPYKDNNCPFQKIERNLLSNYFKYVFDFIYNIEFSFIICAIIILIYKF